MLKIRSSARIPFDKALRLHAQRRYRTHSASIRCSNGLVHFQIPNANIKHPYYTIYVPVALAIATKGVGIFFFSSIQPQIRGKISFVVHKTNKYVGAMTVLHV